MSLTGTMAAGVSGVQAQSKRSQVVAGNMATQSATAAKREVTGFLPLVAGGNATAGVYYYTERDMSQGLIEPSSSELHWAVGGNGFFSVATSPTGAAASQEFFVTRNGEFYKDKEGYLRSPSGHYLMGVTVDQAGAMPATFAGTLTEQEAINISQVKPYFRESTQIDLAATLPASAAVGAIQRSNIPVVDSLGGKHTLTITYTKTNATTWNLTVDCTETNAVHENNGGGATPYSIDIAFNPDGSIATIDGGGGPAPDIFLDWNVATSAPANATLTFNLGTVGGFDGLTIAGDQFVPTKETHDGVETGNFTKVSVDENGLLSVHFNNGGSTPLYQLMLVKFDNPAALESRSGGTYIQTTESGPYSLRKPKEAGLGKIIPNARESSNADTATEFTTLIRAQSEFGMNAKVVQTANEMLDVLQSIKR